MLPNVVNNNQINNNQINKMSNKIGYGNNKKKRVMRIVQGIQTRTDRNQDTEQDRRTLRKIQAGKY